MSDIVKGLVLWKNMTIGEKTDFIFEGNSKATGNFTDQKSCHHFSLEYLMCERRNN